MTPKPWIVRHREGWCALPSGAEPDPEAINDPTLCGYVVNLRGGSKRGWPDCPDCLAALRKACEACDYDTGTAYSGPSKCPRPARFVWDDQAARKKRPVCGVHARSVRSKFGDSVTPIESVRGVNA